MLRPSLSPSVSYYTNNFSLGWKKQRSLYKIIRVNRYFQLARSLHYIYIFAAMQCSHCSQLNEHESLVAPPARKGPLWQIWAKLINIYNLSEKKCARVCLVLISSVERYNSTCCCRPHPSPPLYPRTLCRSQHHSSLSDGGILTRNNPYRACRTVPVWSSPCISPAERSPPPCQSIDREDRAEDQSSLQGSLGGILHRTSGIQLSVSHCPA